jgi:hypothetical protein
MAHRLHINSTFYQSAVSGMAEGYLAGIAETRFGEGNKYPDDITFSDESIYCAMGECAKLLAVTGNAIEQAFVRCNYTFEEAGRDFWHTRNLIGGESIRQAIRERLNVVANGLSVMTIGQLIVDVTLLRFAPVEIYAADNASRDGIIQQIFFKHPELAHRAESTSCGIG